VTKDYTKCTYKKREERAKEEESEKKVSSESEELTDYHSLPGDDNNAELPTDNEYFLSYLQETVSASDKPVKVEPIKPTLKVA
jgi:hypothetical protein